MTNGAVLGIDAGGTGTRAVLVDGGAIVQRFTGAPMNVLLHADAVDRLVELVEQSGASLVGIGLPGLRGAHATAALSERLSAATSATVVVGNDADAALAGAFPTGDGAVVLAGTGSIALGRSHGVSHRAGGHGFLLGDEGSGWWIGRQALRAALAERDDGLPPGPLSGALTDAMGSDLDAIVATVYADPRDRTLLAGLVPAVAACDDASARAVLAAAADALAELAAVLRRTLGAPDLPVAYVGGIFNCPAIRDRFVAATGAVPPQHPPEMAAALMAQGAAG
ncbi:MAG: BadF/BadG/BcrA/BcrD ATPase family protein [Pseudonocardiales bacterium]